MSLARLGVQSLSSKIAHKKNTLRRWMYSASTTVCGGAKMSAEQPESMAGLLVMELMEYAVNLALSSDPKALEQLADHTGKVIRVKTLDPHAIFYLTVCDSGVQLSTHHEDMVNARMRLPTALLARLLVGGQALGGDNAFAEVRVAGDEQLLRDLLAVAIDFNLWHVTKRIVQRWLPEFQSLEDLLRLIRDQDPGWMARLEHLPQLTHETFQAVKELRALQGEQLEEMRRLRLQLDRDRRAGQVSTVIGLVMIVAAFLLHNGYLAFSALDWSITTPAFSELLMLIVALVILVPRLMGRR